jgi:uncharacterized protein (DUF2336 family)
MSSALALVKEVEATLRDAPIEKRTDILRRVTDLFVVSAPTADQSQVAVFDGVMAQLITYVEQKAVAELSRRIATFANAPPMTARQMARDDNLEISGPILAKSPVLTDHDLIEIAASKSQAHLAQIALRPHLTEKVTDALVDFGDNTVASRLAANAGARFSQLGMAKLVMRAEGDEQLTVSIAGRNDIPLRIYQQLLAQATVVVRNKLLAQARPEQRAAVEEIMTRIAGEMAPERPSAEARAQATRDMAGLSQQTDLLKAKLFKFANERRIAETLAGLATLSGARFDVVEHLFYSRNGLGVVMLCKAVGFDWISTEAIISASPMMRDFDQPQLDELHELYDALSTSSAQRLLRFWEGRQAVISAVARAKNASPKVGAG